MARAPGSTWLMNPQIVNQLMLLQYTSHVFRPHLTDFVDHFQYTKLLSACSAIKLHNRTDLSGHHIANA